MIFGKKDNEQIILEGRDDHRALHIFAWKLAMNVKHKKYVQKILDPGRFDQGTTDPKSGMLTQDRAVIKTF